MNYGEVEEPSLSQSQRTSTARRAAAFAIPMVILSKLDKASRASLTAKRHLMTVMQVHHIDTDYYDRFFGPGAYGPTHAAHMATWHP